MPSIPQSLLWISLVVLWLFVLVPMLINRRDTVRRTSDVALATRVLNTARGARLILPVTAAREYDLRIAFTRRSGRHTIGAILAIGDSQVTFELDANGILRVSGGKNQVRCKFIVRNYLRNIISLDGAYAAPTLPNSGCFSP